MITTTFQSEDKKNEFVFDRQQSFWDMMTQLFKFVLFFAHLHSAVEPTRTMESLLDCGKKINDLKRLLALWWTCNLSLVYSASRQWWLDMDNSNRNPKRKKQVMIMNGVDASQTMISNLLFVFQLVVLSPPSNLPWIFQGVSCLKWFPFQTLSFPFTF